MSNIDTVDATFNFLGEIFTEITGLEFTDDNDVGPIHSVSQPNYADYDYSGTHPSYFAYPMNYKMQDYMYGQKYLGETFVFRL